MLTIEKALEAVLSHASSLSARTARLVEARDCRLAEDVIADVDLPPFDKALVDGYALRSADLAGPATRLRIGEEITAGRTPTRPLAAGEAAPIMTGAPLPEGADTVVMIESTRLWDGGVLVEAPSIRTGQNRLLRGREMRAGDIVAARGERLNPARLGVLASVGRTSVSIIPRPRLAIVPTGDELVDPGQSPGPGQIRNSNSTVLQALAESAGVRAECLPIAPDERDRLHERLAQGLDAEVLLITGGVSAGRLDLVPETLTRLGVDQVFHKVRLRPGKPIWFGLGPSRADRPRTLVFGLPGNPVSGMVGFLLFVRPAIDVLSGAPGGAAPVERGRLTKSFQNVGDRPSYIPARFVRPGAAGDGLAEIEPLEWAGSADLRTVARSDGFAIFPEGDRTYESGSVVGFLRLS